MINKNKITIIENYWGDFTSKSMNLDIESPDEPVEYYICFESKILTMFLNHYFEEDNLSSRIEDFLFGYTLGRGIKFNHPNEIFEYGSIESEYGSELLDYETLNKLYKSD